MATIFGYCILIVFSYFVIQLVFLIFSVANYRKKNKPRPLKGTPKISILVPMRDEENNVVRCLTALNNLSYPKDKIEILIANDGSKDYTVDFVDDFIKDKPQFSFYNIGVKLGKARGKANALAHLAQLSTGEFLFFTDADIAVPVDWIQNMVSQFDEHTGVVSGTTIMDGNTLFAKLQGIEWLNFMGMVNRFANAGIPCTAVGNNMVVRRQAYLATGGYENILFSVTEDFKLFKEITRLGWGWKNILNPGVLNVSHAMPDLRALLMQRKRWLSGAMELQLGWKVLFALLGFFTPALLFILFVDPLLGLYFWAAKFFLQALFITILTFQTGRTDFIKYIIPYEFYSLAAPLIQGVYFIFPFAYQWKGRSY